MKKQVFFEDLGLIPFEKAWHLQQKYFDHIQQLKRVNKVESASNHLLFCEHPHVFTIGKSGKDSNLLVSGEFLSSKGAELYTIDRGGDITYHGPGQIMAYPILDLEKFDMGIKDYIHHLEEAVIRFLEVYGIKAERKEGATGVWLEPSKTGARKICAIGVRTSRYVSMHGLSLNVNTDLAFFDYIHPCGFRQFGVSSMQQELGRQVDPAKAKENLLISIASVFGMELIK